MTDQVLQQGFERYAAFFERLTPQAVPELRQLATADMHFRDPFNDVHGIEQVIRVFDKMFEDAGDIRFEITGRFRDGARGVLLWRFYCRPRSAWARQPWRIDGASEIGLADDGRVCEHLDHWDAASQLYERLPVIGGLLRLLKRRLQIDR